MAQKMFEIMAPLKYLSNSWRALVMPLINCEICFQLKWSRNSILVAGSAANNSYFKIFDTKLYIPVAPLSTEDNIKLLRQLKEQLIGTNIYLKQSIKCKIDI